jgi:hypothetical protein
VSCHRSGRRVYILRGCRIKKSDGYDRVRTLTGRRRDGGPCGLLTFFDNPCPCVFVIEYYHNRPLPYRKATSTNEPSHSTPTSSETIYRCLLLFSVEEEIYSRAD